MYWLQNALVYIMAMNWDKLLNQYCLNGSAVDM